MNLSPQNAFGELLLDLIEAQYEGDIDTGILALMQTTGLAEQEVVSLINGDVIIEDQNLLGTVLQAFPDADSDDIALVVDVAVGVEEADRGDLQAAIAESQHEQEYNNEYGDEYADVASAGGASGDSGFGRTSMNANFNALANAVVQQQQQINQLTNGIADFQAVSGLEERLHDLDVTASRYVNSGMLPPSYKSLLVGDFANSKERLAQFGMIAEQNNVDLGTMLFATEYALGMMADASKFVEFSDYSLSEEDVQLANFSASLDRVVQEDLEAIFNN